MVIKNNNNISIEVDQEELCTLISKLVKEKINNNNSSSSRSSSSNKKSSLIDQG